MLLKENRSIVSSSEGTTRDYLETSAIIEGIPVRLFDTAGLRESSDEVEKEGIKRTEALLLDADLVVYVVDKDEIIDEKANYLYVYSKSDLYGKRGDLSFSSLTGEGLGALTKSISDRLVKNREFIQGVPSIDSERQKQCLEETCVNLERAISVKEESFDIIALYFQASLTSLSELSGEVTSEELLDVLFSSFCLGK